MTGSLCASMTRLVAATSSACESVGFWTTADAVAVLLQPVVDALPAGAVHETAVDKDNAPLRC